MFVLFETTSKCNLRYYCVQSVGYEQTERMQDQLFKINKEISDLRIPAVAMDQINEHY